MEKKSYKSWTISDVFWEAVKDEIPQRQRVEGKIYKRKPGGGRKPLVQTTDAEATHSFFNRSRKLLIRFEKKADNYLALVQFACAVVVWRKFLCVHC